MTTAPIDLNARLDSHHLAVLEMLPPGLLDLSDVNQTRANIEALFAAMPAPELPATVAIEDVAVPGLDGDPDVMVRLYRPEGVTSDAPALYWIHGGGMVLGSVEMNDPDCAAWADEFGCLVASVEYRLAPENPFPAPMNDCYAGLSWLASSAGELGIDPARIVVGGASAGGGLAAGLALMARDRGGPAIGYQFLVYPMVDFRNVTPSSHGIVDDRLWNREANVGGWAAYLDCPPSEVTGLDPSSVSPYASPAVAPDLSGLPPAYINVGDLDMFLDEDVAYAQALNRAGVPVELHIYPGAFHGSNSLVVDSPVSIRWQEDDNNALRRVLG